MSRNAAPSWTAAPFDLSRPICRCLRWAFHVKDDLGWRCVKCGRAANFQKAKP